MHLIYVAVGGAFGAVARLALGDFIRIRAGASFPWGTLGVNLLGCLALGAVIPLFASRGLESELRSLVAIGFLGAFTTFSTFGYETAVLMQERDWPRTLLYVGSSVGGGVLAVFLGLWVASAVSR